MTNLEFHLESFMLYCSSKNLSKKTLASYEQSLKLFLTYLQEHFKIVEAAKVQTAHIRHYIKYVQERGKYTVVSRESAKQVNYPDRRTDFNKPVSMTTIANYVRNIKVFFNYLFEIEREIPKNPVGNLENPKTERRMKKIITPEEFKKVLESFDTTTFHGYRNFIITKLLLDTGMRVSECINLTPEVLEFNHKSILIKNAKNNHERYVYFSFKIAKEIKQWILYKDRYNNSPFLFPTNRGTPLEIRNYEKALRDAGKSVGVDIHPHQLRNNFAKYYILNGGDWFSLCRIMGHSSVEVTQKAYLDFTNEEIGKKYQKHSPLAFMDGL
ncbi:tyrosine-type recombinase/integrase [Paenibacillus sp. GCM10027628]|uniref:tyrosine-type recombinase/integrase n=1 Tax=Paenibacillus sp. GCM10027628 TaxID=3273413 RepID=UPI0036389EBB